MNNLEDDLKNKGIKFHGVNICMQGLGPAKGDFSCLLKSQWYVGRCTNNLKKL